MPYDHDMTLTHLDTCLSCNCEVELDFVPAFEGDTLCALCEVQMYGIIWDEESSEPLEDWDELDLELFWDM